MFVGIPSKPCQFSIVCGAAQAVIEEEAHS